MCEKTSARISLIIPVYNGAAFLRALFQNLIDQHFSGLEVIFVDDGSQDGSGDLIQKLIKENENKEMIRWRLVREENQGQGASRNTGIAAATGEWTAFMDQDDKIRQGYLERMYREIETLPCDVLTTGYDRMDSDGRVTERVVLNGSSWSKYMNVTPWGKLYRTSFLREHGVKFARTPFGEDIYFGLKILAEGADIRISSYVGYCWVNNQTSFSRTVHRRLNESASALSLFRMVRKEIIGLDLSDSELQYFFLKTAVYHVLYIAGDTETESLKMYNNHLFQFLSDWIPAIFHNPLIRPDRPIGERRAVRLAVWGYIQLYRIGLDGLFLTCYGKIRGGVCKP